MTVPGPQQRLKTAIESLGHEIESIEQVLGNLDFACVIASLQNYFEEARTVPDSCMNREDIVEFLAHKLCESQPKEKLNRTRFVIEKVRNELTLISSQLNKTLSKDDKISEN